MIKSLKRYIAFCMVLLMTISSFHIDAYAADQYKGGVVIEDDTPKVVEEGLMPSTGDVKAVVLMVEFQDVKASVTKDSVRNTMFGESNSMNSYYKTSSYGKLDVSGDVYDWYKAPNNRGYYEDNTREYPPNEYLFRDVITAMDSQVDFSQYDSDNDGYVDIVYLVYAGKDDGYQSLWWAYMDELIEDVTVDGKKIAQYVIMPEDFTYLTAAHETGHAMGLQDYYDAVQHMFGGQAYYGTNSLMCTCTGDLDVLSKWMLGWLEPQIISENKTISLRPSNEYPDAAVIESNVPGADENFFIIEYRTPTQNNEDLIDGGVSIFRVNGAIDSQTGAYKYDVSSDEVRLIEHVAIDDTEGYVMGTTQEPTSYIVQEKDGNVQYLPTGITVDNVSIDANIASMDIAFGDATITGNLEYETINTLADSRICYILTFPVGVTYVGGELTATDGINEIPLTVSRDSYGDSLNKNRFYLYTTEDLNSSTTYTIDIPAGAFMAFDGRISEAEELQVTTSSYGEIKKYEKEFGDSSYVSESLPYEDGGFVYFTNEHGSIYMKTIDVKGASESKLVYDMGTLTSNGMNWYSVVQACQLDDGSYVVTARDNKNNAVVKISSSGHVVYTNEVELNEGLGCLSAMGKDALLGLNDEGEFVILSGNNQIEYTNGMDIHNPIVDLGDKYAVITGMNDSLTVMDKEFKVLTTISSIEIGSYIGVDVVDGNIIAFEKSYDDVREISYIYASTYNEDGNLLEKGLITSYGRHSVGYNKVYKCEYGYVFTGEVDLVIDSGMENGMASPVANIMVTDKNYRVLYKCSFDYNGNSNGDSIKNVAELSNGTIVCNSPWCDYVLEAPAQADQHKHSYGNDTICDACGYTVIVDDGKGEIPPTTEAPTTEEPVTPPAELPSPKVDVTYHTHIQTLGDTQGTKKNGEMAGTSGMAKRLENIWIDIEGNDNLGIQYTTHCQTYGWMPWSCDGESNGTSGEAKRLEAIMIQLTGADKDKYDLYYRVHAQSYGWLGWAKNGEPSGTAGYGKRLEGIQVVVVKKGEAEPGLKYAGVDGTSSKYGKQPYVAKTNGAITIPGNTDEPNVMYKTHVQTFGWQKWMVNGQMSGTSGKAKRLEGINIKLSNAPYEGDIVYTTHVQKYGWKDGKPSDTTRKTWKKNGAMSGTNGEAKRLEAICIDLTGEMAERYDIYYRVHAQTFGWLGWAKNGEESGTAGYAKRLEGIQIVLVPKDGKAPANNYGGITSKDARSFIQK